MNTLFFFNTTIVPNEGLFSVKKISAELAGDVVSNWEGEKVSAVGHEATAVAMSTILGVEVSVNRIHAQMRPGDAAVCLKVKGRLPEGQILTLEELEKIGYEFFLIYHLTAAPTTRCMIALLAAGGGGC